MNRKNDGALVLLSGGQDSTTCLYWALSEFDRVRSVSFRYGQRHVAELAHAIAIAEEAGVPHEVIDIRAAFAAVTESALTDETQALAASGGIHDEKCQGGLPTSFTPGRNLIFLALATSLAARQGLRTVVTGVCQTDFAGFPDCRREFIDAMQEATSLALPSSMRPIRIETPLMYLDKRETVELAASLPGCMHAVGRSLTCYHGKFPGCGTCPACELRIKGFAEAGLPDPQLAACLA